MRSWSFLVCKSKLAEATHWKCIDVDNILAWCSWREVLEMRSNKTTGEEWLLSSEKRRKKPGEEQELGVENLVCLESCCKGGGEDGTAPGPAV